MKGTLTFDLMDPDDRDEFELASAARDLLVFIQNLENRIRDDWKYQDNKHHGEYWRDVFCEELSGMNIDKFIL